MRMKLRLGVIWCIAILASVSPGQDMDIPDVPDTGYRPGLSSKELRTGSGMAAATSQLYDKKIAGRYAPAMAFDGKLDTAWVEGRADDGIGEKIGFAKYASVREIKILPGYGTAAHFSRNNRVKKATLSVYEISEEMDHQDGMIYRFGRLAKRMDLDFRDEMALQGFSVGVTGKSAKGYLCVLEIKDVYRGSACRDTCIAEIQVTE